MVKRTDVVAPAWRSEQVEVSGLLPSGDTVEVTVRWLDAGGRWKLSTDAAIEPDMRMYAAMAAVVIDEDGESLMDAAAWQAWTTQAANDECVRLLDKVLAAAGLRGDPEKK